MTSQSEEDDANSSTAANNTDSPRTATPPSGGENSAGGGGGGGGGSGGGTAARGGGGGTISGGGGGVLGEGDGDDDEEHRLLTSDVDSTPPVVKRSTSGVGRFISGGNCYGYTAAPEETTGDPSGEGKELVPSGGGGKKRKKKKKDGGGKDGGKDGKGKDLTTRVVVVALTTDCRRETWDKKVEFLLAVIGFAVDLGNVWRFPYICYQNGGGAFLIPYTIMLIFGGLPLFYMELALGQFHRSGCLTIWKRICPALKGVGYAICIIDIYMGMYYNTIIGWAVYYLIASFQSQLPWTSCHNEWNTDFCKSVTSGYNYSNVTSPAREFFERQVLEQNLSDGLNYMGPIKPSLALCVFSVFVLVYFSLWKGVKSTGKAVWVTAIAPYIVLIILLIRGVTLPGAGEGIKYYLTPQWHKLLNTRVWIDAASQIFFSLGPGFGTLLALSSYNKFNNNCYRDAVLTSSINCLTSFLAGFVIFSVLGYMAKTQNKNIEEVGLEGPGLVFIVYPEAIAIMTGSVFWSIIFFLMLITLGLDSTFGGLEAMITALCDEYPKKLGRHREIFVAVLLLFIYICALPTTTYGGVYLVNLLNVYGPGLAILFVVFVEAAGVCWIYGTDNFSRDIEKMIGHRPGLFWRLCWKYISPVFILIIFIFSLVGHADMLGTEYNYPDWSIKVGWALTGSSIMCIPVYIVYKFLITSGSPAQRWKLIWKGEHTPEGGTLTYCGATSV